MIVESEFEVQVEFQVEFDFEFEFGLEFQFKFKIKFYFQLEFEIKLEFEFDDHNLHRSSASTRTTTIHYDREVRIRQPLSIGSAKQQGSPRRLGGLKTIWNAGSWLETAKQNLKKYMCVSQGVRYPQTKGSRTDTTSTHLKCRSGNGGDIYTAAGGPMLSLFFSVGGSFFLLNVIQTNAF